MPSEREYHRALAESLLKSVGFDDAVDCAPGNRWQGVLAQLLSLPKLPPNPHRAPPARRPESQSTLGPGRSASGRKNARPGINFLSPLFFPDFRHYHRSLVLSRFPGLGVDDGQGAHVDDSPGGHRRRQDMRRLGGAEQHRSDRQTAAYGFQ